MSELQTQLFNKGYIKLQPGSYRIWISKRWHEMFSSRRLVNKNLYKQYIPNRETLPEFIKWLELYDKAEHDRDFPLQEKWLSEEELIEIRREIL